jgi:hypothetical protein
MKRKNVRGGGALTWIAGPPKRRGWWWLEWSNGEVSVERVYLFARKLCVAAPLAGRWPSVVLTTSIVNRSAGPLPYPHDPSHEAPRQNAKLCEHGGPLASENKGGVNPP